MITLNALELTAILVLTACSSLLAYLVADMYVDACANRAARVVAAGALAEQREAETARRLERAAEIKAMRDALSGAEPVEGTEIIRTPGGERGAHSASTPDDPSAT